MKRTLHVITIYLFAFLSVTTSYSQEWENYLNGDNVTAIAEDGNYLYVGSNGGGLRKINKSTGDSNV